MEPLSDRPAAPPRRAIGALIALPTAAIIQAFVSTYLEQHDVIENTLAQD